MDIERQIRWVNLRVIDVMIVCAMIAIHLFIAVIDIEPVITLKYMYLVVFENGKTTWAFVDFLFPAVLVGIYVGYMYRLEHWYGCMIPATCWAIVFAGLRWFYILLFRDDVLSTVWIKGPWDSVGTELMLYGGFSWYLVFAFSWHCRKERLRATLSVGTDGNANS